MEIDPFLIASWQIRCEPANLDRVRSGLSAPDRLETFEDTMKPPAYFLSGSACPFVKLMATLVAIVWAMASPAIAQSVRATKDQHSRTDINFRDVAAQAGVSFRFNNGGRGRHDLPEIMGGGVALFDADGDHRLDIYLCNGGPIEPGSELPDTPCRLYLNRGDWRFEDVTERACAPGPGYAMGAAVGDYDGDGRPDLLVTGWRDQRLYRNLGHGRFEDVTLRAGVASDLWSTSAAFADLDGDGDQDLYVTNYLDFDPKAAPFCAAPDGRRDYCGPEDFPAQPDRLYRNNGDGTFSDVSRQAGIDHADGRGLGVLIAELTGDHHPDIYVANDGTPCWLFANRGNWRFEEVGETAGVARDGQGQALAGMGIACGDVNSDGMADLVVTNFMNRATIPFLALGDRPGTYADASNLVGLKACTRDVVGFGIAVADFNGDGRVDLIQANGHVLDRARLGLPLAMPPKLLRNRGGRFEEVSAHEAGDWFGRSMLGRGLAVGDLDDDGRTDVVVNVIDAPAAVLRNLSGGGRSLAIEVIDRSGAPAVGALVRVENGAQSQMNAVIAGGSYLSASPAGLYFGLETAESIERIEVEWPWGPTEVWLQTARPPRGPLTLRRGTGRRKP
jgi:hypothetical protein